MMSATPQTDVPMRTFTAKDLVLADSRPIVAALKDPAAFAAVRVDMDAVVWANGFDLAPAAA